jgi:hypothetical protein
MGTRDTTAGARAAGARARGGGTGAHPRGTGRAALGRVAAAAGRIESSGKRWCGFREGREREGDENGGGDKVRLRAGDYMRER